MLNKDLQQFIDEFNIVDNALKMRQLLRWNGRDVLNKENLAEHTHLVVACVMHLYKEITQKYNIKIPQYSEHTAMRLAMLHDSVELFRGDILSVTKDAIPGLRAAIDAEERAFMESQEPLTTAVELTLVELADLMACYKFLERELRYPNNDFVKEVYVYCKKKFDNRYKEFLERYGVDFDEYVQVERFQKGYLDDAGVDILLHDDVVFLPMSTKTIDLNIQITPYVGEMSFLCARTSAANKGLVVATCPIDPNFTGTVTAIVHNVSNNIITYKAGESFCQYVTTKIVTNKDVPVKKEGKRSTSKLGGTDKC